MPVAVILWTGDVGFQGRVYCLFVGCTPEPIMLWILPHCLKTQPIMTIFHPW